MFDFNEIFFFLEQPRNICTKLRSKTTQKICACRPHFLLNLSLFLVTTIDNLAPKPILFFFPFSFLFQKPIL